MDELQMPRGRGQGEFMKRNEKFMKHLPELHGLAEKVVLHTVESDEAAEGIIFFLNRLIVEEFMEVLVLASHDYGFGAKRLLRGMFERLLASLYIEMEPAQADLFLKFGEIQRLKYANLRKAHNGFEPYAPEEYAKLKAFCDGIQDLFQEVLCKTCDKKRPGISWTKLNTVAMAEKVKLNAYYVDCFFEPTMLLHNTTLALNSRLQSKGDKAISFIEGPQPKAADSAMKFAHILLVITLNHHDDHFKRGYAEAIKGLYKMISDCWPSTTMAPTTPGSA